VDSERGPILVVHKSFTDNGMWKFGLRPRNSFSGKWEYINGIFFSVCAIFFQIAFRHVPCMKYSLLLIVFLHLCFLYVVFARPLLLSEQHKLGQYSRHRLISLSIFRWIRSSRVVRASDCQSLGSVPAASDTVKFEGRQMKQC
jgi:hypothetical protein